MPFSRQNSKRSRAQTIEVRVLATGFAFRDQIYGSLVDSGRRSAARVEADLTRQGFA